MALTGYKSWAVTNIGNVIPGAAVEVRRKSDNSLADIYTDATGATPIANGVSFVSDSEGSFEFYAEPDRYDLIVGSGASQVTVPVDITDGRAQVPFATNADFLAWVADGGTAADGTIKNDGNRFYVASSGATSLTGLSGWEPLGTMEVDDFADIASVTASMVPVGGELRVVGIDMLYERAADAATDEHLDYSGSGGVKWYEAGIRYTTETRLTDAVTRIGANFEDGAELFAPDAQYRKVSGSFVSVETTEDALALAGAKLDDAAGAVTIDRLADVAALAFLGNPGSVSAPVVAMGRQQALDTLGFAYYGTTASGGVDLPESPTTTNAPTAIRCGTGATAASGWTTVNFSDAVASSTPVVVATVVRDDTLEYTVKLRNETTTGFDIQIRQAGAIVARDFNYIAMANGD